jgi:hypothetical protein
MGLDHNLAQAAAEFARRRAGAYGKAFRDGGDDEHPLPPIDASPALPTAVHLIYRASNGEVTERVVTLLSAWRTNEIIYFCGRCHLRKALRTFRADHVVELVCLATGEAPDDPERWIVEHALYQGEREADYTPYALRACRDELALLAYVGSCDGVFDDDEVEVAIDYVMLSTDRDIDRDKAAKYIRRLEPSVADLHNHVRALSRHPERWARLTRAMRRLVDADRLAATEEQIAWSDLSQDFDEQVSQRQAEVRKKAGRDMSDLLAGNGLAVQLELSRSHVRSMVVAALNGQIGPRP